MKKLILIIALIALVLPVSAGAVILTASDFPQGQDSAVLPFGLGTAYSTPRPFIHKYLSPEYSVGVGVEGGYVDGEIDGLNNERITVVFNRPVRIADLSLGFLFPPNSGYGDAVNETARVVATTSDGQVLVRYLTAEGCSRFTQCEPGTAPKDCPYDYDNGPTTPVGVGGPCWTVTNCTASWTGPNNQYGLATSSSSAILPGSGIWDVNNPFGPLLITRLEFSAAESPYGPQNLGNSDFSLMGISIDEAQAAPLNLGFSAGQPDPGPPRSEIVIQKESLGPSCSSDLLNFPLLVSIQNDPYLRHVSYGGLVESIFGWDIFFTDGYFVGLAHEVEHYDPATGTLIAWVNVPTISASSSTVVRVLYGFPDMILQPSENRTAVWDGHYKAVYHLNQKPKSAGSILDSTINALNLAPASSAQDSTLVPAKVGYGLKFRGWDFLLSSKNLSLSNGGKFTMETWVKSTSFWGGRQAMVSVQDGNTHGSRTLTSYDWPMGIGVQFYHDANPATYRVANQQPNDAWVHLVARYDGSKLEGFANGQKTQFTSYPGWGPLSGPVTLGVWRGQQGWLNWFLTEGYMDEVRISDDARSNCWIETGYRNQSSPSSFYTFQ